MVQGVLYCEERGVRCYSSSHCYSRLDDPKMIPDIFMSKVSRCFMMISDDKITDMLLFWKNQRRFRKAITIWCIF